MITYNSYHKVTDFIPYGITRDPQLTLRDWFQTHCGEYCSIEVAEYTGLGRDTVAYYLAVLKKTGDIKDVHLIGQYQYYTRKEAQNERQ